MNSERTAIDPTDKPRENCGVVGIIDFSGKQVIRRGILMLNELNHRGQDAAGFLIQNSGFHFYNGLGSVNQVFTETTLADRRLHGYIGTGHVRYKIQGGDTLSYAQPLRASYGDREIGLAHNGNAQDLILQQIKLASLGINPEPKFDSNILAHLIVSAKGDNWIEKVQNGLMGVEGSYSLVLQTDDGHLLGIRDPWGNRPLSAARIDQGYVLASESVALNEIDTLSKYELKPGEILDFSQAGVYRSELREEAEPGKCVFELIYLADETSIMDGATVASFRRLLGKKLAINHYGNGEVVTAVPDAGEVAAEAYAYNSGKPKERLILKKKGRIKRSFMQGEIDKRKQEIEAKFRFSPNAAGRDIDAIDDSIVNGITMQLMVEHFRNRYNIGEIHARSTAPPIIRDCHRGVTFRSEDGVFVALDDKTGGILANSVIAQKLGVTTVDYTSLEELNEVINESGRNSREYCTECFGGPLIKPAISKPFIPQIEKINFEELIPRQRQLMAAGV